MKLIHHVVRRPIGVTMAVLTLLLFGVIAIQGLGLDLLPDLELPIAAVVTIYPGADPSTVETAVTAPLENLISTVPGLARMRSTSSENLSVITAEFDWGADRDAALKALENNVSIGARLLPSGAEPPIVFPTDPSLYPLIMVAVSGEGAPVDITHQVETFVKPRLQQVDGVASVEILGGTYEEISVRYDSAELQAHGITPTLLYQVIAAQNVAVPAGTVTDEGVRYNLKAGQLITDLESLRNQPVALRQGEPTPGLGLFAISQAIPIRLRDVADVAIEPRPREGATQVNGEPAVILRILKQSGENSVQVSSRVRQTLSELEREAGLRFHPLTDQADLIRASISNLSSSALVGGALAVTVLLLFLRSAASIAVIALAIPLSIVGAVVIMYAAGITLNMMSLGGLALAVGMLVDNAIVVLENIFRLRQEGKGSREAAAIGGGQIASAIVASTLTTLVVFVPIFFVQSWAGVLFREMGIAVSASLVASLVVALIVVPVAASKWLGPSRRSKRDKGAALPLRRAGESALAGKAREAHSTAEREAAAAAELAALPSFGQVAQGWIQRAYRKALEAWTSKGWLTPCALLLCLAVLILTPGRLESQFLPPTDGGLIQVRLTGPAGWSASETASQAASIEEAIRQIPGVTTVATLVGDQGSQDPLAMVSTLGAHEARITVVLSPKSMRQRSAAEIAEAISAIQRDPRVALEIEADRTSAALGDDFFPGVTIELSGPELSTLRRLTGELAASLSGVDGFRAVSSSVGQTHPELYFRVTERSMQSVLAGGEPLTAGQVGLALRNHLLGVTSTSVMIDGRLLPIVVRPGAQETESIQAIREFRVPGAQLTSAGGQPILDRIATLAETESEAAIQRRDRARVTTVRAELDGIGLDEARQRAQRLLDQLELPPGYRAQIVGIHQVIDDTLQELTWVLLIAVVLIYAVLATQFESVGQPLVVLVTVPLAVSGALVSLWASKQALGVPSLIGALLLVGVAVNNAIVMIDAINRRRSAGSAPAQAILDGAVERLRPIMMTSFTSIFGLVPLVLAVGEGSELLVPMAVAVMGGLVSSTFLSLFVIPGLLSLGHGMRRPKKAAPALVVVLLVIGILTSVPTANARGRDDARWHLSGLVGAAQISDELHPLLGVNVSRLDRYAHYNVQVSGSVKEGTPPVVSAAVGRFIPSLANARLTFRSDWWLKQGRQSSLSLEWLGSFGPRRLSLTRALGERPLHPWSGEPGAPEGWHVEHSRQIVLSDSLALENRLWFHARDGSPPTWLITSGSRWRQIGLIGAHVEGGLLLNAGSYRPALRVGATLTLIPHGDIEVALSPPIAGLPEGWPVLRIGFSGSGPSPSLSFHLQWRRHENRLEPQALLRIAPTAARHVINVSWSPTSKVQGRVTIERSF